jgi:hypothetical protein
MKFSQFIQLLWACWQVENEDLKIRDEEQVEQWNE